MNRALKSLAQFFLPTGSPNRLGLFRILFGLYLCWRWFSIFPNIKLFFSLEGIYLPLYEYPQNGINSLVDFFGWITAPVSVAKAYLYYYITATSIVLFTVGLFTRLATIVFTLFWFYYYLLYLHTPNCTFDRVIFIFFVILIFSPADKAYSISAWLKKRKGISPPQSVPLWTQRLITLEVAWMYFGAGLFKALSATWSGGEVIHTALMGDWSTSLSFYLAGLNIPMGIYDLLVLAVIFFELTAPFMLYDPRYHKLYAIGGTLFHLSNAILLNVWEFMFFPLTYMLFVKRGQDPFLDRIEKGS